MSFNSAIIFVCLLNFYLLRSKWLVILTLLTHVICKPRGINLNVCAYSNNFPICFLCVQQITTSKDGARNRPLPLPHSESLHTNLVIPEVQRWRWVGGWRRRKAEEGMEDESRVEIRLAEHLFLSIPSSPPQKNILFSLPALVHPLIPYYSTAYVS